MRMHLMNACEETMHNDHFSEECRLRYIYTFTCSHYYILLLEITVIFEGVNQHTIYAFNFCFRDIFYGSRVK